MIDGVYEYLTASYVDWLRLDEVPFMASNPTAVFFVGENAAKPSVDYSELFPSGVVYNGLRYVRSRDGKAFDLIDADKWALTHARAASVQEVFDENRRVSR